jgi:peptide/nickel transport system permease protein
VIIAVFVLVGVLAPVLTPYHPTLDTWLAGSGSTHAKPIWFRALPGGGTLSENFAPVSDPDFNSPSFLEKWNLEFSSPSISAEYESALGENGSVLIIYNRNNSTEPGKAVTRLSIDFNYPYGGRPARFIATAKMMVEESRGRGVSVEPLVFIEDRTNKKRYDWGFGSGWEDTNFTQTTTSWISPEPSIASDAELRVRMKRFNTDSELSKIMFPASANYSFGLELTFWDPPGSAGENVKVMVYVDELDLRLYGTAFGILGCDWQGRDIFSQLIYGSRISISVGLLAAVISVVLGLIVGLVAGYMTGIVDEILMRFTDALLVLPGLPLLIVLIAVLGTSITNLVVIIGFLGWMGFARVVRSQVLSLRERPFIEAAKAIGAGKSHIIFKHIVPNVMSLVYVTLATSVPAAIVSEAALSFLGFFDPYIMSWGRMLNDVQGHSGYTDWWWVIPPGLCIAVVSVSFILLGYALDEILNPRLRIRR